MKRCKWLSQDIGNLELFLTLCISEKEYYSALQHLKVKATADPFLLKRDGAAVHWYGTADGEACLVCIDGKQALKYLPVQVIALLTHEAVHVWQRHCELIGERTPGYEQEAYAIQHISQTLMSAFFKRFPIKKFKGSKFG